MNRLGNAEALILLWFAIAVVIEIVSSTILFFWLRAHGVRPVFGLTGIPGYLEREFDRLCRETGRQRKLVLSLRAFSIVNVVLAIIFAIGVLANRS